MRSLAICIFFFAVFAGPAAARDETVDELKAKVRNTPPQDRMRICVEIAQLQLHNADKLYRDGDVVLGRAAVEDIVTYSEQARDSAIETRKRLKNVEIAVRKMAERLRDVKRTLPFEDQPPVENAVHRLEEVRTSLLKQMFSKEKK